MIGKRKLIIRRADSGHKSVMVMPAERASSALYNIDVIALLAVVLKQTTPVSASDLLAKMP